MFIKIFYFFNFILLILKYTFSRTRRYLNIIYCIFLFQPKSILEIGVYKGTRSIEMIKTSLIFNSKVNYYGFDLFEKFYENKSILKNELSKEPLKKLTIQNKLKNLCRSKLYSGFTKDTLKNLLKIEKKLILSLSTEDIHLILLKLIGNMFKCFYIIKVLFYLTIFIQITENCLRNLDVILFLKVKNLIENTLLNFFHLQIVLKQKK